MLNKFLVIIKHRIIEVYHRWSANAEKDSQHMRAVGSGLSSAMIPGLKKIGGSGLSLTFPKLTSPCKGVHKGGQNVKVPVA